MLYCPPPCLHRPPCLHPVADTVGFLCSWVLLLCSRFPQKWAWYFFLMLWVALLVRSGLILMRTWLFLMLPPAPPRSPPAPPFSPKPGFSLCSPVAACAAIAPSLPHLPISNETEPSMYQNATKYSRAKYYMYYSIAYQNRNITSQQNTTYHNIMPRSRWDGRAGFPLSWGFGFI